MAGAHAEEHLHLATLLERLGECTRVQGNDQQARSYFEQALEAHNRIVSQFQTLILNTKRKSKPYSGVKLEKLGTIQVTTNMLKQCYLRGEQVLREAGIETGPAWASLYLQQSFVLWKKGNFEEAHQTAHSALSKSSRTYCGEQNRTVHECLSLDSYQAYA